LRRWHPRCTNTAAGGHPAAPTHPEAHADSSPTATYAVGDARESTAPHVLASPVQRRPRCATPRDREPFPARGVVFSSEVRLPARHGHRVTLPRARRGLLRRVRRLLPAGEQKRAIKLAALRDCGRRCVYCAAPLDYSRATLDHVHPLAKGGAHAPGNVVVACPSCNRLKTDMLPAEFFLRYPWAGSNFIHYARAVHRALKRQARRAVSLAFAQVRAA
jgi:5-methylcytosine-specific restriction endonuclease McrA